MRKLLSVGVVVAAVLAVVTPIVTNVAAQAAPATTTVVLSFDEGWASQSVVPAMLDAHGMKGTFYVNSGVIGTPDYLTWPQLDQFKADGQEIGGGSLNYEDLTALPAGAAQTSICEDRGRLINHGFDVTSFAYPGGNGWGTPAVRDAVQTCGYNSARSQWGLWDQGCVPGSSCGPDAESIPPADALQVQTPTQPTNTTPATTLEASVTNAAANGGGLVPFVFHQICDVACDTVSTPQATLQTFLDWLQNSAPAGTVVKTMGEVIGGAPQASPGTNDTAAPVSTIKCNAAACQNIVYGGTIQVTLAATDTGGSGLEAIRYTTDGTSPTLQSPIYTGVFGVSVNNTTVKYQAWDVAGNAEAVKTQLIVFDDTYAPVSTISCNSGPCNSGFFVSTPVHVTLAATDVGTNNPTIRYTTDGTTPTTTHGTIYSGSFDVSANGTVKFFGYDTHGNSESVHSQAIDFESIPPVAAVTCNGAACSTGWYRGAVHVVLSATDTGGSGLAGIHYTLDNTTPTSASPVYSAPLTLSASKTVKFVAIDNAGNASAVQAQLVQIDTAGPVVAISPGNHARVTGTVKISIRTSDAKSGVAKIGFAIDSHHVTSALKSALALNWNTKRVSKGAHKLTAKVIDRAGNTTIKTVSLVVH
jgi:hypothetical protein